MAARSARIGVDSGARLDRPRPVVERILGWLLSYEHLALRHDSSGRNITARARPGVTLICARRLPAD